MPPDSSTSLNALCDYLSERRQAILQKWRKSVDADPDQTTSRSLTRRQFNDHIPEVLDAFERKLRAGAAGPASRAAHRDQKREEVKHGLHRWQQGYRLQELMNEWEHLQLCLFEELEVFAAKHPDVDRAVLANAHRQMILLVHESIGESTDQYERMQQAEAVGHVSALTLALDTVNEIERRRAALIHQAVHDLRGDVFGVSVAANLLGKADIALADREKVAAMLAHGVEGLTAMLHELMELARLEAGQEVREVAEFDAAVLITELCAVHQSFAVERGLFLKANGPATLVVDGDAARVRRLLQNLLLNALRYTEHGGVQVSWDEDDANWWIMVDDTGPGMVAGSDAPMVDALKEATVSARESDEKAVTSRGETAMVLDSSEGETSARSTPSQQHGEGIGLSIVKRLCELLDGSLELVSSVESGTTFRVVLPRRYANSRPSSSSAA
ncbi:MAG: sensor histidine kinase [Candidatus Binatia bacterium]